MPASTLRREYDSCPLMTSMNFSNTKRPMVSACICGNSMDEVLSSMGKGTFFCGCIIGLYEMLHSDASAALAAAFFASFFEGPTKKKAKQ